MKRRHLLKLAGQSAVSVSVVCSANAFALTPPDTATRGKVPVDHLPYHLVDGFVHNWLVAGPQAIVIPDAEYKFNPPLRPPVVVKLRREDSQINSSPVEGDSFAVDGTTLPWRYRACADDHLIDLTGFHHNSRYLRAWAYTVLESSAERSVSFRLFTNGPASVWLNGRRVNSHEEFDYINPRASAFDAPLRKGSNALLVRFEQAATRNSLHTMALRLDDIPAGVVSARVPIKPEDVRRRQALEQAFEQVHLSRDNYGTADEIRVNIPALGRDAGKVTIELQASKKVVRTAVWDTAKKNSFISLGTADALRDGDHRVVLTAGEHRREMKLYVFKDAFSQASYGTYEERRVETLNQTASRSGGIYAEIAKMELGRWKEVDLEVIKTLIDGVNRRKDVSDFDMLDLLGILIRHGGNPSFPPQLKPLIESCILGFKYWVDEPGSVAMTFGSENHQIAFHTCEILAGQLYPDRVFTNVNQNGAWHRAKGERLAIEWLRKRAAYGFEEWDSNGYFGADAKILGSLTDLAQNPLIKNLSRRVLDKLLLLIAVNSFKGSFGSTHGRTGVEYIKDARFEPTSGIGRLLWGLGGYYGSMGGAVHLACARSYRLPPVIAAIALDQPEALWSRERQALDPARNAKELKDVKEARELVNKVTYKTPDFMLCSAQGYKPGERGYQQHIWQATMGPDAVVFTTHPACISENGSQRPNFWAGNATLPRAAQWQDCLASVHRTKDEDWLDFTHAYFPVFAFDEHALQGGWAFARKGKGYLALTAARGIDLITRGDSAYRELRSTGRRNVWLCQMGRAARDGDFAAFRRKVLARPVTFGDLSVQFTTLGGDQLSFGWEGALLVNEQARPLTNSKHIENAYCVADWPADELKIRHGGEELTIHFTGKL